MYKLFLTIRYLTRKKIVVFPILVVWLCLMMMIIVTSIMGGFVDKVRETNREVMGDIIISSKYDQGWSGYVALQADLKKQFPEIVASTPMVHAHGLANVPAAHQTVPVEVMGIDPVGRSEVSRFRETLFREYISPHQAAKDLKGRLPATNEQLINDARTRYTQAAAENLKAAKEVDAARAAARAAKGGAAEVFEQLNYWWLLGLIVLGLLVYWIIRRRPGRTGWSVVWGGVLGISGLAVIGAGVLWPVIFSRRYELALDRLARSVQAVARAERTIHWALELPAGKYDNEQDILRQLVPKEPTFSPSMTKSGGAAGAGPAAAGTAGANDNEGCIVGSQMGFTPRDQRGNFMRAGRPEYVQMLVTVFPESQTTGGITADHSYTKPFTIVDDSYTGVFDIDLTALYVPFETGQLMAGLRPDPDVVKIDPSANFAPQTNEVLIKLKPGTSSNEMKLIRARMSDFVTDYQAAHPDMDPFPMLVQTWDERQAKYLSAVENEKVMQTFILGLMSLVVLVVIFLIFYMIVRDKTRDIGIVKAIGGSEEGVAGIFLTYGLFIGVVGGVLGVVSGVAFVTHTNQIHEWIYQMTGIVIWDRSVYLFDRIPDTVHPVEVAVYFGLALLAGVIGALIPAIVAASEDPVKAVRYE